jgi:hypothetical protein
MEGSTQTFRNNKGALRHVFHKRLQGVSPFLLSDYDLVQSCHHIISPTIHCDWHLGEGSLHWQRYVYTTYLK